MGRPPREAALRGFMALAMDMVRVDPDRRPSAEMVAWYSELSGEAGVEAVPTPTARDLMSAGLEVVRAVREAESAVPVGG
jgi:hypothetical protein